MVGDKKNEETRRFGGLRAELSVMMLGDGERKRELAGSWSNNNGGWRQRRESPPPAETGDLTDAIKMQHSKNTSRRINRVSAREIEGDSCYHYRSNLAVGGGVLISDQMVPPGPPAGLSGSSDWDPLRGRNNCCFNIPAPSDGSSPGGFNDFKKDSDGLTLTTLARSKVNCVI